MRLAKSTPLRLTLALVGLFTAVSLASLAVSYVIARSTIENTIHDTLIQDLAGFLAAPSGGAVATLVEAQGRVMDPSDRVIGYRDEIGRLHGNGAIVRTEAGFEVVPLERGENVAETYFILTQPVHGGYLTLAVSADARDNLRQTMTTVLLVSLLPTIAIALAGGLILARRSSRRISAIEVTLSRLTGGDLGARVPTFQGRADDLNDIAKRIDKMAAAHEENVAALRQVSSDIAHDLKTPIQRVSVLLERAAAASPDDTKNLIDQAGAETRRIAETFQALLQIARLEGDPAQHNFAPVDLARLVGDIGDLYGPAVDDAGHVLNISTDDPSFVPGDRRLLAQLLTNLVENTLHHTGKSAEITIGAVGPQIFVSDTGPGIPHEKRDLVLRRLYRLETSRTTPGSGLGLALVKAIADLHDTTLVLEDNNPGLTVRLTFAAPPDPVQ